MEVENRLEAGRVEDSRLPALADKAEVVYMAEYNNMLGV